MDMIMLDNDNAEDAYRKGGIVLYKQAKYTLEKEIREELLQRGIILAS